jgi:hypothetical protein
MEQHRDPDNNIQKMVILVDENMDVVELTHGNEMIRTGQRLQLVKSPITVHTTKDDMPKITSIEGRAAVKNNILYEPKRATGCTPPKYNLHHSVANPTRPSRSSLNCTRLLKWDCKVGDP